MRSPSTGFQVPCTTAQAKVKKGKSLFHFPQFLS
uniref:Uncharacterized protein n=1 Tax=Arundo donax TaxID=35708 RepID=A0A0A9H8I2_ARUDO